MQLVTILNYCPNFNYALTSKILFIFSVNRVVNKFVFLWAVFLKYFLTIINALQWTLSGHGGKEYLLRLIPVLWSLVLIAPKVHSMLPLGQASDCQITKIIAPIEIYAPPLKNVAEIEVCIEQTRAHHLLIKEYYQCFNVDPENEVLSYNQLWELLELPFRLVKFNDFSQHLFCVTTQTSIVITKNLPFIAFRIPAPQPTRLLLPSAVGKFPVMISNPTAVNSYLPGLSPGRASYGHSELYRDFSSSARFFEAIPQRFLTAHPQIQMADSESPSPLMYPYTAPAAQVSPFAKAVPSHPLPVGIHRLPVPQGEYPVPEPVPVRAYRLDASQVMPKIQASDFPEQACAGNLPLAEYPYNSAIQPYLKESAVLSFQESDPGRFAAVRPPAIQVALYPTDSTSSKDPDVASSYFPIVQQEAVMDIENNCLHSSPALENDVPDAHAPVVESVKHQCGKVADHPAIVSATISLPLSVTSEGSSSLTSESEIVQGLRKKIEELEEGMKYLKNTISQKPEGEGVLGTQQQFVIKEAESDLSDKSAHPFQMSIPQGLSMESELISNSRLSKVDVSNALAGELKASRSHKANENTLEFIGSDNMGKLSTFQPDNVLREEVSDGGFCSRIEEGCEHDQGQKSEIDQKGVSEQEKLEDSYGDMITSTLIKASDNGITFTVESMLPELCQEVDSEAVAIRAGQGSYGIQTVDDSYLGNTVSIEPESELTEGSESISGDAELAEASIFSTEDSLDSKEVNCKEDFKPVLAENESMYVKPDPDLQEKGDDIAGLVSIGKRQQEKISFKPESHIANSDNNAISPHVDEVIFSDQSPDVLEELYQQKIKEVSEGQDAIAGENIGFEEIILKSQSNQTHLTKRKDKKSSNKKRRASHRNKSSNTGVYNKSTFFSEKTGVSLKVQGTIAFMMVAVGIVFFYPEALYGVFDFIRECFGDFYAVAAALTSTTAASLIAKSDASVYQRESSFNIKKSRCLELAWLREKIPVPIYNKPPEYLDTFYCPKYKVIYFVGVMIPDQIVSSMNLTCRQRKAIKKSLGDIRQYENKINAIMLCGINNDQANGCYGKLHQHFKRLPSTVGPDDQPLGDKEAAELAKLKTLDIFSDSAIVAEAFKCLRREQHQDQDKEIAIRPVLFVRNISDGWESYKIHLVPVCCAKGKCVMPGRIDKQQLQQRLSFNVHGKLLKGSKVRLERFVVTDTAEIRWEEVTRKIHISKSYFDGYHFSAQVPKSGLFRIKVFQKNYDQEGSVRDYVCVDGNHMVYYPFSCVSGGNN